MKVFEMIFPTPLPDEYLPECDDDDLLCRLNKLYQEHSQYLYRVFYGVCNDEERANDAVHESFLRLFNAGLDDVKNPRAWMTRVGRNWLTDLGRRDQRRATSTGNLDFVEGDEDPSLDAISAEQRAILRQSLKELRDPDRRILSLKYNLNWSSSEIATHLAISADAVDMRLTRARRRLASVLAERGVTAIQAS